MSPITILTFAVGNDYKKKLAKCFESKMAYASKHGYRYIQGGDKNWDRTRPISWSKVPFLLEVCSSLPDGAILWLSDADILITNMTLRLEDHVLPLLPDNKDILVALDSYHTMNCGSLFIRNTPWLRDFMARVYQHTDFTYHIWWEQAAICHLYSTNESDKKMIEVTRQHKKFNAFLRGKDGEPLWEPSDFLVHFAGVGDEPKIQALVEECLAGKTPRIAH
jgi:hypothetical protein